MSHFKVAVITAKKEKLEEMLASYDENLEVEPYIEKTKKEIIKEAKKVLDELQGVRPEKLTGEAKRLFDAIMLIADGRDKAYKELEEKDKIIEELTKKIKIK